MRERWGLGWSSEEEKRGKEAVVLKTDNDSIIIEDGEQKAE